MLFQTFEFAVLIVVLLLLLLIFGQHNRRKLVLLLASYFFYLWWNPAFILLILYSTAVDYVVGRKMGQTEDPRLRKRLLWVSLVANLAVLAFFKYGNFFQTNVLAVMQHFGHEPSWNMVNIILPWGISFYTFQSLSYTIDVYRKKIPVTKSPLDFALFVAFFPQLIAGPIVRAAGFLPQLQQPNKVKIDRYGLFLFLNGLFKKVIIADNLGLFVQKVYFQPDAYGSVVIWLAALAFFVQVYCDFSGYSDMAIAMARMLGFELPENFRRPYCSLNPTEFWRRWHISLSTWFRDYVYVPLGGNSKGHFVLYRNLFLTMLVSGLWHGAGWNYILWACLHGVALVVHKLWLTKGWGKRMEQFLTKGVWTGFSWVAMQWWFLMSLILFRIKDLDKMFTALKQFLFFDFAFPKSQQGLGAILPTTLLVLVMFLVLHVYAHRKNGIYRQLVTASLPKTIPICIVIGWLLLWLWPTGEAPFIYFEF